MDANGVPETPRPRVSRPDGATMVEPAGARAVGADPRTLWKWWREALGGVGETHLKDFCGGLC